MNIEEKDLTRIPFFYDLKNDFEVLKKYICIREVQENRYVYKQGDEAIAMYFILKGSVKIKLSDIKGNEKLIETLSSPSVFGEMSLIDTARYPVSVIATEKTRLAQLTVENFEKLIKYNPQIAIHIIKKIANFLNFKLNNSI